MRKLLLFDLDGTLLLTHGAGRRAMERAGVQVLGERFSLDGVLISGSLDPWIFAEAVRTHGLKAPDGAHEDFKQAFHRELLHELVGPERRPTALPGILELLAQLREHPSVTLGLLTGNYPHTGSAKLRSVGIDPDWFDVTVWGDEGPDRAALVALAIERHGEARARDVIIVGDTPHDVQCARAHGCRVLSVATGGYGIEVLKETGADVVIEDLADAAPLWQMIKA